MDREARRNESFARFNIVDRFRGDYQTADDDLLRLTSHKYLMVHLLIRQHVPDKNAADAKSHACVVRMSR